MSVYEALLKVAGDSPLGVLVGIVFLLMTLVQITPLKINPWSWIAKHIGRAINGEVIEDIAKIRGDIKELQRDQEEQKQKREEDKADEARNRILRFSDELRMHTDHSEEMFDQVLRDIDKYEKYCRDHPDYKNSKAVDAIQLTREVYHKCKQEDRFI